MNDTIPSKYRDGLLVVRVVEGYCVARVRPVSRAGFYGNDLFDWVCIWRWVCGRGMVGRAAETRRRQGAKIR